MVSQAFPRNEIRSAREVAHRALALFAVVATALGSSRTEVAEWLQRERIWEEQTPLEVDLLSRDVLPDRMIIDYSWHSERLIVLLLGTLRGLPFAGFLDSVRHQPVPGTASSVHEPVSSEFR